MSETADQGNIVVDYVDAVACVRRADDARRDGGWWWWRGRRRTTDDVEERGKGGVLLFVPVVSSLHADMRCRNRSQLPTLLIPIWSRLQAAVLKLEFIFILGLCDVFDIRLLQLLVLRSNRQSYHSTARPTLGSSSFAALHK